MYFVDTEEEFEGKFVKTIHFECISLQENGENVGNIVFLLVTSIWANHVRKFRFKTSKIPTVSI